MKSVKKKETKCETTYYHFRMFDMFFYPKMSKFRVRFDTMLLKEEFI